MPSENVLGKRKRKPAQDIEENTDAAALEDAQAIFRRHFEAQFAPITDSPEAKGKQDNVATQSDEDGEDGIEDMRSDSESDGDDEEWGGLSGADDDSQDEEEDAESDSEDKANGVQVIDHSKPLPTSATLAAQNATMTKREMRAFLSSRPPDATATDLIAKAKSKQRPGEDDDAQNEDSKTLLANDLALQRLIGESHILASSNPFNAIGSRSSAGSAPAEVGAAKAFTEGRTRKLTTDLRLQKLGSKASIFTQQKMPMGMRKGIHAAREEKEARRRREAKENGIILERPTQDDGSSGKKGRRSKSGRGGLAVDMPGMGKFRNGELRLNKHDVKAVEMEGMRLDNGKRRRRRR